MSQSSILVVDDESDTRGEICDYLTRKGYKCESAVDGARAMARLRESGLDLLITDMKMPWLDGEGLVRHARALAPGMPIIVITGHGSYGGLKEIENVDADTVMTKPISLRKLLRHVQKLIG